MAKNNKKNTGIDLRGKNNWTTAKNTTSAALGLTSTALFTTATLFTNGLEVVIHKSTPTKVGKAIEKNAKLKGLQSFTKSFMSDVPTTLATNEIYLLKDKFFGDNEPKHPAIAKAKSKMNKAERQVFKVLISTLEAKSLTKKDINKVLKVKGIKDGLIELANIASA